MTEEKQWYKSKTMQVNVCVIIIGILTYVQGTVETGTAITLLGVANVILRTITSSKVTIK